MSAAMELHVALSLRLDAREAYRLAFAYKAEVLREAAAVAGEFPARFPDFDAMKEEGLIGPHTMCAAIRDELCRLADGTREKSSREAIATPQLTGRLAQLFDAIHTWPGQWTTTRVMAVYRAQGLRDPNRSTARGDLQALTERGHLMVCGPENDRYYLLARKDGHS